MLRFLRKASAAACVLLLASSASAQLIGSGHVMGNGTASPHAPTDTPLIQIMNQAGSGIGAGVPTVLGVAPNVSGGVATIGASPINGYCVQFNSSGAIVPTGGACSVGGGGGTVASGTAGQYAWYQSSGSTVVGSGLLNGNAYSLIYPIIGSVPSLTTVLSGITAGEITIQGEVQLTANTPCPAGVTLHFDNGAYIDQTGSYTLTMNCAIVAPLSTIFVGFTPGQITFASSSGPVIWAEWWGAAPGATSLNNSAAIQAAIQAGMCGPGVRLGYGTFTTAASGSPTGYTSANINISYLTNPNNCPWDFGGMGIGSTIIKNAASNYFNIIGVIGNYSGNNMEFPFSLHDMTLDGNGANNPQQTAGDRYQECLYTENITGEIGGGINIHNIECLHSAYQGMAFNSTKFVHAQFRTHLNYSSGWLLTGNTSEGATGYGSNSYYDVDSYDNGNNDSNHQIDCSDLGAAILVQYSIEVHVRTTNNNQASISCTQTPTTFPGGADISRTTDSHIFVTSTGDRDGVELDSQMQNDFVSATVTEAANIGVRDINGTAYGQRIASAGNELNNRGYEPWDIRGI